MTVNELLQKLVELAREEKGQWEVLAYGVSINAVEPGQFYKEVNLTNKETVNTK